MEETQTQTVETVETPQAEPASPQAQERAAVYAKYYDGQPAMPQQTQETTPQEPPAPVAQTPAPTPAPQNEVIELITGLKSEIETLKEKLSATATPASQPPPGPMTPEEKADWISYLQQGKFDEGKRALQEEMERTVGQTIRQQAVAETLETFRIQQQATEFVEDLRKNNPDVLPLEDLITYKVAQAMEVAKSSGKIKSSQDFLDVYKASVTAEVDKARNIVHQLRADGKTEALTTKRTVLSATPLTPNAVNPERGVSQNQTPGPETTDDYIARRMQRVQQFKGMNQ